MLPFIDLPPEIPHQTPVIQSVVSEKSRLFPDHSFVLADSSSQTRLENVERAIGVCQLTSSDPAAGGSGISPVAELKQYLRLQEHKATDAQGSARILVSPRNGELEGSDSEGFAYFPNDGFIGNDSATLIIELSGKKYRVEYFFRVMQSVPEAYPGEPPIHEQGYCPVKARVWRIASTPDVSDTTALTTLIS